MFDPTSERLLWAAFVALFLVVSVAAVLPVEPLVGVLPLWAAVVVGAILAMILVAGTAVRAGWGTPREVGR